MITNYYEDKFTPYGIYGTKRKFSLNFKEIKAFLNRNDVTTTSNIVGVVTALLMFLIF